MPRPHNSQDAIRDMRVTEGMLAESKRENENSDRTESLRGDLRRARLHAAAALLRRDRKPGGPSYEMADLLDAEAEYSGGENTSPLERMASEMDEDFDWTDDDDEDDGDPE